MQRHTRQSPSELNSVAWVAHADLPFEEWLRIGCRLGLAGRSTGWWIGDWVRYGTAEYGSKYTVAARVTGYDPQTLMNMVHVATRFEVSRRRENLSWSHHAELAALDLDEQEPWLDRATEERLSVRDLRELLADVAPNSSRAGAPKSRRRAGALTRVSANSRSRGPRSPSSTSAHTERIVVCPHCGGHFVNTAHER